MCAHISLHSIQTRKKWKSFSPPEPYKIAGICTSFRYNRFIQYNPKFLHARAYGIITEVRIISDYRVEICGVNTTKLPLLNNEEKEELFQRVLDGDKETRKQCIKGNLCLALSVIQCFSNSQENIDGLFQIGCIGLIKAINNFDIAQNVKFSTYTVPVILGEVRKYLRDNNSIRVSHSLRDAAYKALYVREQLTGTNSKKPTLMETAQEIGVSKEDVIYALDAIQTPVNLYELVYTDGGDPLFMTDQISNKKNLEENRVEDLSLVKAMKRLPERERRIIDMRSFEGKTQVEVAQEIHISQAQVSRFEKNALKSIGFYLSWLLKPLNRYVKLSTLVLA